MIKVGIIGLGLIGSSILRKLSKKKSYELFCVSKSSFKEAKKYSKNSSDDLKILKNCDIIFVCSKISDTADILEKLNSFLDEKTIVADCASIKKNLLNKKYKFNFILSHPMAGSEKSGFRAGVAELFSGAKWLIGKNNELLEKIIKDLGAVPYKINMKNHDKYCASISHFPTLLSFLLFDCADSKSLKIASSGFRDTTRLAMTERDLVLNMLNLNEKNISQLFKELQNKFNYLKKCSDSEKIKIFRRISKKRKEMYDSKGKNIF